MLRTLAEDRPGVQGFLTEWDRRQEAEEQGADIALDELQREESDSADQVVVGTIHAAKGREYRSVVIVDYDVDLSRADEVQREEERRVLYVGVTRAMESVMLTVDTSKPALHLFMRELITPYVRDEEVAIARRQHKLGDDERSRIVELEQVKEEISCIESGRELARCRDEAVRAHHAVNEAKEAVSKTEGDLRTCDETVADIVRRMEEARRNDQMDAWRAAESVREGRLSEVSGDESELAVTVNDLTFRLATSGLRGRWWAITGYRGRLASELEHHANRLGQIREELRQLRETSDPPSVARKEGPAGLRERAVAAELPAVKRRKATVNSHMEQRRGLLAAARKACDTIDARVTMLSASPEIAIGELRRRLAEAQQVLDGIRADRTLLDARLHEIELLNRQAPAPG